MRFGRLPARIRRLRRRRLPERFCNAKGSSSATCNELNIKLDLLQVPASPRRELGVKKRRQADINDDVYYIEISFPAESYPVTNIKRPKDRLLAALVEPD